MNVLQTAKQRRSIRRFTNQPVPRAALVAMADAARLAPTSVNRQPMQFAVISRRATCGQLFPHTRWAGRIPDGSAGPDASTQPTAYILLLVDTAIQAKADAEAGAAAMSVMLAAESMGVASCWLANLDRHSILSLLGIDEARYTLHSLVALGYPAMRSRAVPMKGGDTDYYLESADILCVPKRAEEDVVRWYE